MPRSRAKSPSRWVVSRRWRTWPRACSARCATRSAGITAALWEVDGPGTALRLVGTWQCESGRFAEFVELGRSMALARGVGLPGRVWASKRPEWIPDVVVDGNFPRADAARRVGLHSAFALPILRGDDVVGVMEFFSDDIREPDPALLDTMMAAGAQIGLYAAGKWAADELDAFFALSPDLLCVASFEGYFLRLNPGLGAGARFRGRGDAGHALHGLRASGRSRGDARRDVAPDLRRTRHQLREPLSHAGRLVSLARLGFGARFRSARRLCGCP